MRFDKDKLERTMEKQGFTVETLAKAIKKSRQGLYYILEREETKREVLEKICKVLLVNLEDLAITDIDDMVFMQKSDVGKRIADLESKVSDLQNTVLRLINRVGI